MERSRKWAITCLQVQSTSAVPNRKKAKKTAKMLASRGLGAVFSGISCFGSKAEAPCWSASLLPDPSGWLFSASYARVAELANAFRHCCCSGCFVSARAGVGKGTVAATQPCVTGWDKKWKCLIRILIVISKKASLGSILCHLSSLLLWGFNFGLKPLVLCWNKNSCTKVKKYLVGAKRTKAMTTEGNWSFKKCPSMATAFSSSRSNFWFVKSPSKDSWLSYNPFVQTCWANMFVFPNRIENIKPKQATAAAHHFLLCSWPVRLVSICFTARGGLEPKWHSHFGNYIDNT